MTQVPPSNDPNNPQPDYPPPGVTPPPGYPQPGYPAQGGYQQPLGYAPQPNIQPVEAANGSIAQAWAQSALPDRRRIASWAQAGTQSWATTSIIAAAVIGVIGSVAGNLFPYLANTTLRVTSNGVTRTTTTTVGAIVGSAIGQVIAVVGFLLFFGLFLALFMPGTFGPFGTRFQRALKPVSLVAVSVAIVSVILSVFSGIFYVNIAPNLQKILDAVKLHPNNPDATTLQNAAGPILGFGSLLALLGLLYLVYAISQYVQSGSVGSALNRWAAFGAVLLAYLATGIVSFLIGLPLGLLH